VAGRREELKQETRASLLKHSKRLFAEQGYARTTVGEIARAAGVTERTFFRYFNFKDELIVDEITAGLPALTAAIIARPAPESPFIAILHGLIEFGSSPGPSPTWMFLEGAPVDRYEHVPSAMRQLMVQIEAALAEAVLTRSGRDASDVDALFDAAVIARAALGASRTVLITYFSNRESRSDLNPELAQRLARAFQLLDRGGRWAR
jgi:AcrR family transcriptional regulator